MTVGTATGSGCGVLVYPDNPILHQVAEETRLVVSEPLGDLAGAWNEVPESSYGVVHHGHDELHPFRPRPPSS